MRRRSDRCALACRQAALPSHEMSRLAGLPGYDVDRRAVTVRVHLILMIVSWGQMAVPQVSYARIGTIIL